MEREITNQIRKIMDIYITIYTTFFKKNKFLWKLKLKFTKQLCVLTDRLKSNIDIF